jgi:TRAP-type transport system small permease protein
MTSGDPRRFRRGSHFYRGKSMLEKLIKALTLLEKIFAGVVAGLLVVTSILVTYNAVARFLRISTSWIEEFSTTAMMWIGLLGAAACIWPGTHMRLELVLKRLPQKAQTVMEVLINLLVAVFALFLVTQGWIMTDAFMTSQMATLHIPIGVTYLALPVAGVFMMLFALVRAALSIIAPDRIPSAKGADADA